MSSESVDSQKYQSFAAFYPFYLSQHSNRTCRALHFVGSGLVLLVVAYSFWSGQLMLLLLTPVIGYGFAWVGHYVFEKNVPATFTYPIYSFMGDWIMFKDILFGKIKL